MIAPLQKFHVAATRRTRAVAIILDPGTRPAVAWATATSAPETPLVNPRIRFVPLMLAALACAPAFAAAPAATTSAKPQTAQQQRMSSCSAQNKGKKGADYKTAQSACLKGQSPATASNAKTPQQQRMAQCSAQNKGKKGADYKAAQSACLKKS